MVPPPEAYDCPIDNNPQEVLSLNGSYAETVPFTAPEISTLFTLDANDEGPRTLGPAPVTALREAFCNSITLDMANIDELAKGHIAQLLDSCPVQFVKPGSPNQRIRNPQEFDSAGNEAVRQAEATNDPQPLAKVLFNINQWKFKRNWKTNDPGNYFNGIYTGELQSDVDDENEANNDADATATPSVPAAEGADMQQLTTLLQQLVNNGNNNNNNAGANHQPPSDTPISKYHEQAYAPSDKTINLVYDKMTNTIE
eukprot:jgi/Psemu1/30614/gm1.30614_g